MAFGQSLVSVPLRPFDKLMAGRTQVCRSKIQCPRSATPKRGVPRSKFQVPRYESQDCFVASLLPPSLKLWRDKRNDINEWGQ